MNRPHPVSPVRTVGLAERPAAASAEDTPGLAHRVAVSAAWYDGTTRTLGSQTAVWRSGKPPVPLRWVLVFRANSLPALLCTDPSADPTQILEWFVLRPGGHLSGGAGSSAWRPNASGRTWPFVLRNPDGTLLLDHPGSPSAAATTTLGSHAAWYAKPSPTFVDAIALVRRHLWLASEGFSLSAADPDIRKVPAALYHRLVDSLAYAA